MRLASKVQAGDQYRERACGTCTLCCRLPEIEAFSKPADTWCEHCNQTGCRIYETRPDLCRDFLCLWMTRQVADHWQPQRSHMLVYAQGAQLTVLVDPDHPSAWRAQPYFSDLQDWAKGAEEAGRYVILFCGDEVVKIEPAGNAN
jgi:hypothetical protein